MRKLKARRRSVSPFGTIVESNDDSLHQLKEMLQDKWGPPTTPLKLDVLEHSSNLGHFFDEALHSSSSDVNKLDRLCQFLVRFQNDHKKSGVFDELFSAMESVFNSKTEDFLISDSVLNSKERDLLIGRYFIPVTETTPGQFSGFLSRWIETSRLDRILHFLDFCKGSTNPTFEYFLVFSNPSFHRVLSNKLLLRGLLVKADPLIKKCPNPNWEKDVCSSLNI